jgi:hypothetical protein
MVDNLLSEEYKKAAGDISDRFLADQGWEEVADEDSETGSQYHGDRRAGEDCPRRPEPSGEAQYGQLGLVTQLGKKHYSERRKEYLPHFNRSSL